MKKKLVYSFLFVFALAVFAPAVVNAMDTDVKIVNVEGDEKKKADTEKKAEKKADCPKAEKKADCPKAEKKADCPKAEKKADCPANKAECDKK
ncbi:MAG: hypothetical protein PF436_13580 [Prolixibacteraceae bacterium]|nr:hypothetical protein [Prolixibacteraceae bacterium]